jgi:hypothetical protein
MHQAINNVVRKAGTAGSARPPFLRGRRKDDVAVAVIAVLLVVLFFVQLGWVILNRSPA